MSRRIPPHGSISTARTVASRLSDSFDASLLLYGVVAGSLSVGIGYAAARIMNGIVLMAMLISASFAVLAGLIADPVLRWVSRSDDSF